MIKLLTAVIRPHRLDAVRDALLAAGVHGMTTTEVHGTASGPDHTEVYRGAEYSVDITNAVRLEVVVDLFEAERLANMIALAARTGTAGDGRVWISDVERVIRIRTGERGIDALH